MRAIISWPVFIPHLLLLHVFLLLLLFSGSTWSNTPPKRQNLLSLFLWNRFSFLKPEPFASWRKICLGGVPRGPPSRSPGSPYGVENSRAKLFASQFPTHPPQTEALDKGPLLWKHHQGKLNGMTTELNPLLPKGDHRETKHFVWTYSVQAP